MNELVKQLKEELNGKEITLVDLDNIAQDTLEISQSIFDYSIDEILNIKSISYTIDEENSIYANVVFEVIEKNEDELHTIVKVTNVEEI